MKYLAALQSLPIDEIPTILPFKVPPKPPKPRSEGKKTGTPLLQGTAKTAETIPPASIPADRRAHWSDLVAGGMAEGITRGVCEALATVAVMNEIEADRKDPR